MSIILSSTRHIVKLNTLRTSRNKPTRGGYKVFFGESQRVPQLALRLRPTVRIRKYISRARNRATRKRLRWNSPNRSILAPQPGRQEYDVYLAPERSCFVAYLGKCPTRWGAHRVDSPQNIQKPTSQLLPNEHAAIKSISR